MRDLEPRVWNWLLAAVLTLAGFWLPVGLVIAYWRHH